VPRMRVSAGWTTPAVPDTEAVSNADMLRAALAGEPFQQGILALSAELVRAQGPGPVADVGRGPGRLTAHLHGAGLDVFGIDLSPAMIDVRRDHPGLEFEVGSMTSLELAADALTGLLAWFASVRRARLPMPSALRLATRPT
jgi:SAM-dependent methyltransferase